MASKMHVHMDSGKVHTFNIDTLENHGKNAEQCAGEFFQVFDFNLESIRLENIVMRVKKIESVTFE